MLSIALHNSVRCALQQSTDKNLADFLLSVWPATLAGMSVKSIHFRAVCPTGIEGAKPVLHHEGAALKNRHAQQGDLKNQNLFVATI